MTIAEDFEAFHAANPEVYRKLRGHALALARRGRTKCGIGMLFEVLRWEHLMTTEDPNSDFKLNNNYRASYARLLMKREPELEGFFDVRALRATAPALPDADERVAGDEWDW